MEQGHDTSQLAEPTTTPGETLETRARVNFLAVRASLHRAFCQLNPHISMKNPLFLLPLGLLFAAASVRAEPINIPLPPPTPLNPDAVANAGNGDNASPTAMVAQKKAAAYTDDELRAMGTGVSFPYELLDSVLRRFVSGKGDFFFLKAKDDNDLNTFARAAAIADLGQFPNFTSPVDANDPTKGVRPDTTPELTFWINVYNGLRIKAISDRYPISSVLSVKDLDSAKNLTVAGKTYSFAELRDKIGKMDPRALFAITKGTADGPSVPTTVFRYSRLSAQLEQATKAFVNDPNKVGVPDRLANSVEVSPYLQEVDTYFKGKSSRRKFGGIREVLGTYSSNSVSRGYFITGDYTINFSLSNGKLNEQVGH